MSSRAGGARVFRVRDRGDFVVPADLLEQVGLDPKMHVRIRVEGKTLVIEKDPHHRDPLAGDIGKKPASDLFARIHDEQAERRQRQLEEFGDRVQDAADDPEPPPSPFGPG